MREETTNKNILLVGTCQRAFLMFSHGERFMRESHVYVSVVRDR